MSADKNNLNTMMCLDIYLSSLSDEEYDKIKHAVKPVNTLPLISWDLSGNVMPKIIEDAKYPEWEKLNQMAVKHLWRVDIDTLLSNPYEAVVVTNVNREICWASDGFTAMTGYPVSYAIGKSPGFLHGKNTTSQSRKKMRKLIESKKPFTSTIVNYRKNKEEYLCEVKVVPISNYNDEITHFIALEREAV